MKDKHPATAPALQAEIISYKPSAFFWRRRLFIETSHKAIAAVVQAIADEVAGLEDWMQSSGLPLPVRAESALNGRALGLALVSRLEELKASVWRAGLQPPRFLLDPCEACVKGIGAPCAAKDACALRRDTRGTEVAEAS